MRKQYRSGYSSAYNTAREYPGTIAAVMVRRSGGWTEFQTDAKDALRQGYDYAREGYDRIRNRQESLTE